VINEVVQKAYEGDETHDLWLADSYDNILDIANSLQSSETRPPVDEQWRSPCIGKSTKNAVSFVKNAQKPPKTLNKTYFVVLDKEQYETNRWLTVCRLVDGEVQSLACTAEMISVFLVGQDRDTWDETLRIWREEGLPALQ
jgi:hypothetical protein